MYCTFCGKVLTTEQLGSCWNATLAVGAAFVRSRESRLACGRWMRMKGLKRNQGDASDNSLKLLKVKMPQLFHPLPHIKNQNILLDKSYQGCSSLFPQNPCAIFHCTSIAHLQELCLHLQGCLSNKIQSRPIFTVERVSQAALPAF